MSQRYDPRRRGFTLFELMVTFAILAILLGLALPAYQRFVEHQRLKDAGQAVLGDFMTARAEAIRRRADVFVVFRLDGEAWCYGVSLLADCDCRIYDAADATACALPNPDGTRTLKVASYVDYEGISLQSAVFGGSLGYVGFDPYRGTTTNGAGTPLSGGVQFRSSDGTSLRVLVNLIGRASVCSNQISGYASCP